MRAISALFISEEDISVTLLIKDTDGKGCGCPIRLIKLREFPLDMKIVGLAATTGLTLLLGASLSFAIPSPNLGRVIQEYELSCQGDYPAARLSQEDPLDMIQVEHEHGAKYYLIKDGQRKFFVLFDEQGTRIYPKQAQKGEFVE